MQITFSKVVHFSRLVKIDGRLHEFNFKKNNHAGDFVFDADTADERGNRIFFRLSKNESGWVLSSQQALPDWISGLSEQVINELKKGIGSE